MSVIVNQNLKKKLKRQKTTSDAGLSLQIAKIVGKPEEEFWSQVHVFLPQEKSKQETHGNLLLAVSLSKESDSKLDLASFGKEIIQRFHETYFSSDKEKIVNKLQEAVNKLKEEFSQELKFDLISGVVLKNTLYLARKGRALAFLKRGEKKTLIFSSRKEKVASGRLCGGDALVLATGWFFDNVSLKLLEEILESKAQEVAENLAAQVSGSLDNSRIAALVIKTEEKLYKKQPAALRLPKVKVSTEKFKEALGWLRTALSSLRKIFPSTRDLYLKRQQGIFKKRKHLYLFSSIFLIALLFLSIFLQGKKKAARLETEAYQKALHFYQEAESLVTLNPLRSHELLKEASELLEEEKLGEKERDLQEKIKVLKEKVTREYKVESPQVFQDLDFIREGTVGRDLALTGEELLILDKEAGVVLSLNILNKSSRVLTGGLKDVDFVALTSTWGFGISQKQIVGGTLESTSWTKLKNKDWETVVDAVGFGGNLYLLDKKGQILKFVAIEGGLADKQDYLKKETDFSESVSLSIDGSVWVLFKNGEIKKFTRGLPDAFTILGLDKPFASPQVLYTNESLENLYILDQNNLRVVVLAKSGEYQAQYVWGGIAGVEDLIASEEQGRILLLSRDKIYEIEIK